MANRGPSLGSCITALVTVLVDPHRGATFQPVLFGAGQHCPIDRLPGLGPDRTDRLVQHRFLGVRASGKRAKARNDAESSR
jgi:hypothetical protein